MQEDLSIKAEIKLLYDLHLPEQAPAPPLPLLMVTHGYGENKRRMMREAREIAPEGFAVAALQGFYQHIIPPKEKGDPLRFGFGWLTNFRPEESIALHHKFVLDVISKLTAEGVADKNNIFLLGFSQTCALNFKFALTHGEVLRGAVGLCGGVPGDLETNENYADSGAHLFYLYGDADEYYPLETLDQYAARMRVKVKNFTSRSYPAKHEITAEMRRDLKEWLRRSAQAA
jgi:phospholipase/carboxylesterase